MPYSAPIDIPNPSQFVDAWIKRGDWDRMVRSIEDFNAQAEASVGADASAVEAVAADGAVELSVDTAGAAIVDGAAGAGVVAAAPFVVAVGAGVALGEGLRQIPGWDNFAQHLGLSIWDGLFGGGGHATVTPEVKLYVADYVQHRFITQRQREAAQLGSLTGQVLKLTKLTSSMAKDVVHVNQAAHAARVHAQANAAVYTDQRVAAAIAYANARAHNVGVAAEAYARRLSESDRRYSHDVAAQAQRNAETYAGKLVNGTITKLNPVTHPELALAIAAALKPTTQALQALQSQVNKLQTENDECTEPMCETVGPKSDWGKLLKKFKPGLFGALLALLAAENPEEVANAAVEVGKALGPVLAVAMEDVLIPLGSHPIKQPPSVGGQLGPFPLPT